MFASHAAPIKKHDPFSPSFIPGCVAMLLCDVILGVVGPGNAGLRRPPPNCESVCVCVCVCAGLE